MIIFLLIIASAIEFHFELPKRDIRCFGDNVVSNASIQGYVMASTKDFGVKINNPMRLQKEGYIYSNQNQQLQEFNFTSQYSHTIQICIQNFGTQPLNLSLQYNQAVQTKTEQSTKPILDIIMKMNALSQSLKKSNNEYNSLLVSQQSQFESVSTQIVILSSISILLTITLTYFACRKIQMTLKTRKLI